MILFCIQTKGRKELKKQIGNETFVFIEDSYTVKRRRYYTQVCVEVYVVWKEKLLQRKENNNKRERKTFFLLSCALDLNEVFIFIVTCTYSTYYSGDSKSLSLSKWARGV